MKTTDAQRKEICKKVKRALTVFNMRMKRANAQFKKQEEEEREIRDILVKSGKRGFGPFLNQSIRARDSYKYRLFKNEEKYGLVMLQRDVEIAFEGVAK